MSYLVVDGVKYYIAITGDGPPLMLLHGFAGAQSNWDELIPILAADYCVIALDIIGHGASDKPRDPTRYQMAHVAHDVIELLNRLTNCSARLLGYSMGGRLALYIATHYPRHLHSLILESASPGLDDPSERAARQKHDQQLAKRIVARGVDWFTDYWESLLLFETNTVRKQ